MLLKDAITIDEDNELVVIRKNGQRKITVDLRNDTVTIETNGDLGIFSEGKVEINAKEGIELRTPAELIINGGMVMIN